MIPVLFGAVTLSTPVMVALAAVLAGVGGYLITKGDGRVESRRRESVKLSRIAADNGFPGVSEILDSYAVGDYSAVIGGVRGLYAVLTDDVQRKASFDAMLKIQLDKRLADPTQKAELVHLLESKGLKLAA